MDELALWQLVVAHPLVSVAIVFLLDGLGLPLMPELAALAAFAAHPTLAWGAILLGLIVALEVGAAFLLHAITGIVGMPPRMQRLLRGYASHLLLHDERLLLLNRVIPVIPMAGAFIRANDWSLPRSLLWIAVGSAAKYGLLLAASRAAYAYFHSNWALGVSLGLGGLFLLASWAYAARQWLARRKAQRAPA